MIVVLLLFIIISSRHFSASLPLGSLYPFWLSSYLLSFSLPQWFNFLLFVLSLYKSRNFFIDSLQFPCSALHPSFKFHQRWAVSQLKILKIKRFMFLFSLYNRNIYFFIHLFIYQILYFILCKRDCFIFIYFVAPTCVCFLCALCSNCYFPIPASMLPIVKAGVK